MYILTDLGDCNDSWLQPHTYPLSRLVAPPPGRYTRVKLEEATALSGWLSALPSWMLG